MSRAEALRASFGDRRPPDISRKITACVSCRKLKVKCNIAGSGPPCTRCRTRGLSCTVNKSLQMLLENDASWKERIEQRLEALERAQLPREANNHPSIDHSHPINAPAVVPTSVSTEHEDLDAQSLVKESSNGHALNLASNLGVFPASSINANAARVISTCKMDIVSRDIISLEVATGCLDYFLMHLNQYIHGILESDITLPDIRRRSPLLTAAVCTVASFCSASAHYRACHDAFIAEVSGKLFSSTYCYDDIRALCIAAVWLDEIAPTLNGLAVRIASQLDLHRCISKMPHTKRECYDRTRLFYLVYFCDHHCSLKYDRPPMTQEWRSLKAPTAFIHTKFSSFQDLGLISQVELWSITRSVFEQFGADVESQAAVQKPTELLRFGNEYDLWLQTWRGLLVFDSQNQASSLLDLYYQSSKLYLYSHIYRGNAGLHSISESSIIADLSHQFRESALSVIRSMLDGKKRLLDMPSYFSTITAFATIVLVKTIREDHTATSTDKQDILRLLQSLAETLRAIQLPQSPSHSLLSIFKGLDQATENFSSGTSGTFNDASEINFDESMFMEDIWNMDFTDLGDNWMGFDEH